MHLWYCRQESQSLPSRATCRQCLGFPSMLSCATTPFPGFHRHHHYGPHQLSSVSPQHFQFWSFSKVTSWCAPPFPVFITRIENPQPCDPSEDKIKDPGNPGSRLCGDRSLLPVGLPHRHLCLRQGARPLHSCFPASPRCVDWRN